MNRYNPVHDDAMVADENGTHVRYADHVRALSGFVAGTPKGAAMESVESIAQRLIPCTCGGYGENNRRHMSDCPRHSVAWEDIAAALTAERDRHNTIAKNDAEDGIAAGRISHDEARQMLSRFINSHFNNPGEKARASIPARPNYDDDLRMIAYINQQRERDAKFAAFADEKGEPRKVLGMPPVLASGEIFGFPPGVGSLWGKGRHVPVDRFDPLCMWYDGASRSIMLRVSGLHGGVEFDGVPVASLYSTKQAAEAAAGGKK